MSYVYDLIKEKLEGHKNASQLIQLLLFTASKYIKDSDIGDICKQVESIWSKKYTDKKQQVHKSATTVCRIPRDIIQHISKFLNKRESIKLGQTNKHLYIESQQQGYIANRTNDKPLEVSKKMILDVINKNKWSIANHDFNAFAFSRPCHVHLPWTVGCWTDIDFNQIKNSLIFNKKTIMRILDGLDQYLVMYMI